jgi:hypothetical protein
LDTCLEYLKLSYDFGDFGDCTVFFRIAYFDCLYDFALFLRIWALFEKLPTDELSPEICQGGRASFLPFPRSNSKLNDLDQAAGFGIAIVVVSYPLLRKMATFIKDWLIRDCNSTLPAHDFWLV